MLHVIYVHLKFKMQEKKRSSLEAMKAAYLGSQKQPLNQFYLALGKSQAPTTGIRLWAAGRAGAESTRQPCP